MTSPTIIDTNQITTNQIVHLQADKIATVYRYLSAINPKGAKVVQPDEAHALAAAGIRLGLVNEGWGDFAHGGISAGAGTRDGEYCAEAVQALGISSTTAVFFAVDVDAGPSQINKLVLPYFEALRKSPLDFLRLGVYGSGAVCLTVLQAGFADLAWLSCSMGWSGSRTFLAAKPEELVLVQGLPTTLANLDCDPDIALAADIGDFLPFAVPQSPAAPAPGEA